MSRIVRIQFGFDEERSCNVIELPLSACRVSGLVVMLNSMDAVGEDEDGGANGEEQPVLVVGMELPPTQDAPPDVNTKVLQAVKAFLLNLASAPEDGSGGVPIPLPSAVTSVSYYLYTLLGPHDRTLLLDLLPKRTDNMGPAKYTEADARGEKETCNGGDPRATMKRLLHVANYLQIEPLVNLVAGYFAASMIEICRASSTSAATTTTTPATRAAEHIREFMRVGHDWTEEESRTIVRHTDWSL